VFTSRWWISERPQLADRGTPSIQSVALVNAGVIFLQVVLGAGFRHSEIPVWPHIVGAFAVMATVTWTAVALRKRFGDSAELSRARALLHAMFGLQFVLGFGAYWVRLASEKAGPTSLTVIVTVTHTVVGALLFAFSILIALICYRLVPRGREVAAAPSQVAVQ
jgi:heme A synthase